MAWKIEFGDKASRQFDRLDSVVRQRISNFLEQRLAKSSNLRQLGAALTGEFKGLWRYRVGDYRILCRIKDNELLIVVVAVGHRRDIYDS